MPKPTPDRHAAYFEAILQLRDISDEVLRFVEDEIERNKIPVAKVQEVKNGHDFYLGNGNLTKNLGKKLQERFGGEHTVTSSLFSRKDSKAVYRLTVLFRGIPFIKGDLVEYQGEQYTIKILGKDMLLQNVKTSKKVHVKYKEMDQIKKTH